MEEKILIKSEQYDVKKLFKKIVIVGAVLSLIVFAIFVFRSAGRYTEFYQTYLRHHQDGKECNCWGDCRIVNENPTQIGFAFSEVFEWYLGFCLIPIGVSLLVGIFVYLWLRSYELTVTDKRIYGRVAWGKRVDLPVDSISATSTIKFLKGVTVATSSGKISFLVIKNAEEIYNTINKLIIERQQKKSNSVPIVSAPTIDEADKLKKYKDLLDSGVITQEEFDAKKQQLLGL